MTPQETVSAAIKTLSPRAASLEQLHAQLAKYNRSRLNPRFPDSDWQKHIHESAYYAHLEHQMLEAEKKEIETWMKGMPQINDQINEVNEELSSNDDFPEQFIAWFEDLKESGPGQTTDFFDWLAEESTYDQMKWFIRQEVAGEAGFEDLTAITQVRISTTAKLEMARNYWDEMGRGREPGMHGPLLSKVAEEFGLTTEQQADATTVQIPEALALGNIMVAMAMNRDYAFHSIGALGAIELTAPGRAVKVYQGLKRLGISAVGQRYYLLHSTLDIKHSQAWNSEVFLPLLKENPRTYRAFAEGALMRLNAGARCFEEYRQYFNLEAKYEPSKSAQ